MCTAARRIGRRCARTWNVLTTIMRNRWRSWCPRTRKKSVSCAAHDTDFFLVRGHQDRQRLRMIVVSTFQVLAQRRPMRRAAVHMSQARQLINEVTPEQQCDNQHECQLSDSNGPLMSSQLVHQ